MRGAERSAKQERTGSPTLLSSRHQRDCRLHAPIWILLVSVVGLHQADRSRADEFTAPRLRVTSGKRALA